MVRHRAWAEDLLQEAFLHVASRWSALRDPGAARAYLWRTAAHLALDGLRRRRRFGAVPLDAVEEPTAPEGHDLEAAAQRGDEVRTLRRALETLPPRERAAVLLRVTARLTFDEVGRALGLTDRGAARLYEAGTERLRARFADDASDERAPRRERRHGTLRPEPR
jgi:RNA polymerase sigma-70 factor (ECF subfamily)